MLSLQTHTLIIGGGPAGSLCGISLQQHHSDCLLVDRARFPRLKLCAGVVTGKAREVLREVLGDDGLRSLLSETQVGHERHLRLWNRRHCFVDCDMQDRRVVPAQWRDEDWRFVRLTGPASMPRSSPTIRPSAVSSSRTTACAPSISTATSRR